MRAASALPESSARPLSFPATLLFAVACGLAVANVYFAQPLLDTIADEFRISRAAAGGIISITQVGYGLGLVLLVPLGDLLNRRRLIVGQSLLSVLALSAVGLAANAAMLLAAMAAVGLLAVVTQVLVAYAASLAAPGMRGRAVGTVTSGIVIGILLARTVSGALSDLYGWRAVYFVSAGATLIVAALLYRALPAQDLPRMRMAYPRLIASLFTLLRELPTLRIRAVLAMLIFAAITTLLTPLVLPLSAPPYSLSHMQVGLFGLAGAAGALGASHAGRMADRGYAQRTTAIGLAVMLGSWLLIGSLSWSIWLLVLGVVAIDYGLQSVHVSNQMLIYRERPEAQSRLTAAYMLFYSIGSAGGSMISTLAYARGGWLWVCACGALICALALAYWRLTLRMTPAETRVPG